MSSAEERAKAIAAEIKATMRAIKAAEARIVELGRELTKTLDEARAEAEAALTVVVYPSGRYECADCGNGMLFTEPTRELPVCENCGHRNYVGHDPVVTKYEPPPPKKYPAGMYECRCGARIAVVADTDEASACELCGGIELKPIQI
jgi:DNA-directed RNA polymerase subunit RPC12/RpoP